MILRGGPEEKVDLNDLTPMGQSWAICLSSDCFWDFLNLINFQFHDFSCAWLAVDV